MVSRKVKSLAWNHFRDPKGRPIILILMKPEIKRKYHRLCETAVYRNLGKVENGIVGYSVWYVLWNDISILFEISKPREKLSQEINIKPQIGAMLISYS